MSTTSTPPDAPEDQDVRDALSALRGASPEARDLSALRRRLLTTAPARRSVRRPVVAIATATVAVGVGIALLPDTDEHGSRSFGGLGTPSALASEVPPVRDGPYRYVKSRTTWFSVTTRGDRTARLQWVDTGETWVSAGWKGRRSTVNGPVSTTGDRELASRIVQSAPREGSRSDGPFLYGDGPLATLDPADLPTGREALAATIREGIRSNRWADGRLKGMTGVSDGASEDAFTAYSLIGLLVNARLTADQRAVFLDVLQTGPGATSGGVGRDSDGREGRVIDLDFPGEQSLLGVRGLRVVFDPASDEILEWTQIPTPPTDDQPNTGRTETVLRSAYVDTKTDRP